MTTAGPSSTTIEPPDSLYNQDSSAREDSRLPWWQRNLLLHQPVLFGTWDGVFPTVLANIFGIIVFLRMGWIVGTAGVSNALLLLVIGSALALITVFSAIGICERTRLQPGGLYFLISHVLGAKIGGSTALLYTFGQAVATALVAVGFGESVQHFFGADSRSAVKLIAIITLLLLSAVNAAGVTWVIRLQLVLLACIAAATIDFFLGSLWTVDLEHGVGHFSLDRMRANSEPYYAEVNCTGITGALHIIPSQSFFTVFGVFFANFLGVLAGVNMSGDLRDPHKSVPLGELSAIGVSSFLCFLFILVLGAVVDRSWLICDQLISERVSLTGFFFMGGLYICSLSSTIGSLLGTPRVLQSIAAEGLVPLLTPLSQGNGPNKNPVLATCVLTVISCVFVLLGDLNQLAILSTMPFLITYAMVNYAYISLAMSYDLASVTQAATIPSYGSTHQIADSADLNELFPERQQLSAIGAGLETTADIVTQPASWYSQFSNRYVSLVGCMINLLILLFIDFWYATIHFAAFVVLYFYIGQASPSCFPGISQFSLVHMFKTAFNSFDSIGVIPPKPYVIGTGPTPSDFDTQQLNDQNPDYEQRKQYHHSKNVTNEFD